MKYKNILDVFHIFLKRFHGNELSQLSLKLSAAIYQLECHISLHAQMNKNKEKRIIQKD